VERLGYTAVWITGTREARLTIVERVLAATKTLAVATGVVNIWYQEARAVADSYHRLEAAYPGRFLLGIGAGHRELGTDFRSPYHALVDYIDVLDELGVPKQRRALAAPGPRVLMLAAERPAGAHPYLVTPAYTRRARELVGPDALLAVVHKVVLGDPASTRTAGRKSIQVNLGLANYRANLIRMGFGEDDLADGGSDALADAPDLVPRAGGPALNQDGGLPWCRSKELAGQPGIGGAHCIDTVELLNAGRRAEQARDPPAGRCRRRSQRDLRASSDGDHSVLESAL